MWYRFNRIYPANTKELTNCDTYRFALQQIVSFYFAATLIIPPSHLPNQSSLYLTLLQKHPPFCVTDFIGDATMRAYYTYTGAYTRKWNLVALGDYRSIPQMQANQITAD